MTDKFVSHGQIEMFSYQMTQLTHTPRSGDVLLSNDTTNLPRTPIPPGANLRYKDINTLSQKSVINELEIVIFKIVITLYNVYCFCVSSLYWNIDLQYISL